MKCFSKSVLGRVRQSNQDYCIVKNEKIGIFDNLFIVADGVGGNSKSDFASKHSCDFLIEQLSKTQVGQNKIEELSTAIKLANTDLYYHIMSNEDYNGMGTTLVCATITKDKLIVVNIGDSRCYYIRNGMINQITHDHSVAEELARAKEIERDSDKYYEYKNQLTRAVGASRKINPDFFELELQEDDYLLLCTDGLTNMVTEEYILNIISKVELTLEDKVNLLINKANENGGKDNITVVLIKIDNIDIVSQSNQDTNEIVIDLNQDNIDIKVDDEEEKIDDNLVSPDDILKKYSPKGLEHIDRNSIQIDENENMSNLRVNPEDFIQKNDIKLYEGKIGRSRKRKPDTNDDIENIERKEDEDNE